MSFTIVKLISAKQPNYMEFGCLAEKGFTIVNLISAKQPNFYEFFSCFFIVIFEKNSERSEFLQKFKVVIFQKKLWNVPNFLKNYDKKISLIIYKNLAVWLK